MTKKLIFIFAGVSLVVALGFATFTIVKAETSGGSPESGATSRIKTIYNHLKDDLSFGSDAAGGWGDWGAYWNRIRSAAEWTPSGDATTTDVRNGVTFYNSSRTEQTGAAELAGPCSTQVWDDAHGVPVTETTNCVNTVIWTMADPAVAGDDNGTGNTDPRTGLIWSKYLKNNAGTVEFASVGGSTWNWNGTDNAQGVNNVAVNGGVAPGKTASLLCSERGNGWRLPTQKELMQAYIDGSYWNLTNPANSFWSATEFSATLAWYVALSAGTTNNLNKSTSAYYVRCVR